MSMAQQPENQFWDKGFLEIEPEPEGREKALRDVFVREYVKDYNPVLAAIRCGFMRAFAEEYAVKFMAESYVIKRIKAVELGEIEDEPHPAAGPAQSRNRAVEIQLIREANYYGPGGSAAARVAALGKLASIYGMDGNASKKGKGGKAGRGGVMVVPGIADIDEWEKAASESQDKLVADART